MTWNECGVAMPAIMMRMLPQISMDWWRQAWAIYPNVDYRLIAQMGP